MAHRHKMSDQCALDKICCSLNGTQHSSARLPPPATPPLKDYWHRVPFYWLVHVNTCDLSSIFVCVHKSTELDRLKSKAASDINAHWRPLECSLKASWPWWKHPRIEVIITDQQKVPKATLTLINCTPMSVEWARFSAEQAHVNFSDKTAAYWLNCAI